MARVAAEIGSTANRYQILGRIAVGGMAEIFLARGAGVAGMERYCVLKRILRERANDAQFVQMFIDEARLAAQLQHPNIASVYDIGMLGDSYFFTMEYVHGETVKSLVQRAQGLRRPLPLACVLTIIAGTAAGLHHAHERNGNDGRPLGIVHRDISPSNVMVSYEGNVKVVDFGVAKADDRAVKTQSGTVKGKISYLSPEQCRGSRVDRRSDLFSLGIVMWEMLTGARLYRRTSDFDNMAAIVHEAPPRPSSRRPEVRAVDDIVMRLLAKSVSDRFQTAQDVVQAIEHASLRAGTILSTSAVSQLIRDLFGARAEPWLEFESDTLPFQRSMISSRPLPRELGRALPDPAEHDLSAVPDLALSGMFDDVITGESILSIDVETLETLETLEPDASAPRPASTVPGSRAARSAVPPANRADAADRHAGSAAPRAPTPIAPPGSHGDAPARLSAPHAVAKPAAARPPAPLAVSVPPSCLVAVPLGGPTAARPGTSPTDPPPGSELGSQTVHISRLVAAAEPAPAVRSPSIAAPGAPPSAASGAAPPGPLPISPATLLDALTGPPRPPTALPSAPTLQDIQPPGSTAARAAIVGPIGLAGQIVTAGPIVTACPTITAVDLSPAGAEAATAGGRTANPSAVTARDAAFRPTWIASPSAATLAPTLIPPWPTAKATPPTSFDALASASSAPPPIRPSAPWPRPSASPPRVVQPAPAVDPPERNVSSMTTTKWRPTRELALRIAPRFFTVIIPAATIGAILAWMLTREDQVAAPPTRDLQITPLPDDGPPSPTVRDLAGSASDLPVPDAMKALRDFIDPLIITEPSADDMQRPAVPSGASETSNANGSPPAASPQGPSRAPSQAAGSSARAPGVRRPSNDPYARIKAMYEQNDFTGAVRACHAFVVKAEVAFACFISACHKQDLAEAQRWLTANPANAHKALIATCKQIGDLEINSP